ncbi:MAG: hypothetical protein AAF196_02430 [Planctomycetota bacterium]
MNLTNLSPLGLLLGALALAGVTFALQILRVRHREQRVVTTMFWRQALQEERVRVFRERFRHPLAWLLITAIAVLSWFAYARPSIDREPDMDVVVLVDGSAQSSVDELEQDLATAAGIARGLRNDERRVFVLSSSARCLLDSGEPVALLEERAEALGPASTHNTIDRVLPGLVGTGDRPLRVYLVGRQDLRSDTVETVQAARGGEVEWFRVLGKRGDEPADPAPSAEVLGFGVDPTFGVLATLRGVEASSVQLFFDGQEVLEDPAVRSVSVTAEGVESLLELSWSSPSAEPGELELSVAGVTTRATWPGQTTTNVALQFGASSSAIRAAFRQVIESDATLSIVAEAASADVTVGDDAQADLRLVASEGGRSTFHFQGLGPAQLQRIVTRTGLSDLDADALATTLGRPVTVGSEEVGPRQVSIDRAVFDGDARLLESRVFPVLARESVHWLANRSSAPRRAAVGVPIDDLAGSSIARLDRGASDEITRIETLGLPFVPSASGRHRALEGQEFEVSLQTSAFVSAGLATTAEIEVVDPPTQGPTLGLDRWLLLIVLTLGVFEWVSVRRGRMP